VKNSIETQVTHRSHRRVMGLVVKGKGAEKKGSGRKRGGQVGHPRTLRKLVPVEELKAEYDLKPATCQSCGETLSGEDLHPYRHQVAEIPPVKVEVTEYR
jgi:transposase